MLRPWVSFIALGLSLTLLWLWSSQSLAWLGGALLAVALLAPWVKALRQGRRREQQLKKAEALDWSVIDNSMARDRVKRDCERPETLGQCTGRDCLVYETCDFNIKKPLP
jgi:membrane protein implicated in regulation of membrane protease activity